MAVINDPNAYTLRKAGLLDTPFIHALMLEGSRQGVFDDFFASKQGQPAVFKRLFRDLAPLSWLFGGKYSNREFLIFMMGDTEIGFVAFQNIQTPCSGIERNIAECAIAAPFRHQGHGGHLIASLIGKAIEGERISAYCTPCALAMQAVLKKHQFELQETVGLPGILPLNYYVLTKASAISGNDNTGSESHAAAEVALRV